MRRAAMAIVVGLVLAAWAGTARGDELVLYPGSRCEVMRKPAPFLERVGPGTEKPAPVIDRVVTFDLSHFVLARESAEACAVCTRDLDYERDQRSRTVEAALRAVAPEPAWRSALRWATVGAAIGSAFILGALLL